MNVRRIAIHVTEMHIVKTLSVLTIVGVTQDFLEMGTLAGVKNAIYIYDVKSHIKRVTII